MEIPRRFLNLPRPILPALLLGCFAVSGCGQQSLPSVGGRVTLDGEPVAQAGVTFEPVGGGSVASGVTDGQGRFRLETINQEGVAPGEYKVTIVKTRTVSVEKPPAGSKKAISKDGGQGAEIDDDLLDTGVWRIEHLIPQRYADPETSGLTVTVKAEENHFPFELTSTPASPMR